LCQEKPFQHPVNPVNPVKKPLPFLGVCVRKIRSPIFLPTSGAVSDFEPRISDFLRISVFGQSCTDLANPTWTPLQTTNLAAGPFHFSDSSGYPARFYRLRWP
jgi:hypothetical protein